MNEIKQTTPAILEKPRNDASEALLFSTLLTVIGGFFESYSYVARDHVFANGQTGNMAKLGMNLAAGDFAGAFKYLIPIVCFALGVYLAEMVKTFFERHHLLHWKQAILLIEILLTVITALVPSEYNTAANVLIECSAPADGGLPAVENLFLYLHYVHRKPAQRHRSLLPLLCPPPASRGQQGAPLLWDHCHLYPQFCPGRCCNRILGELCHPALRSSAQRLPVDSGPASGYPPIIPKMQKKDRFLGGLF